MINFINKCVIVVLVFVSVAVAQNRFAALEVQPYGEQIYDLATDSTSLPSGGLINEREVGVTIDAGYASYSEGNFVSANRVNVEGRFGTMQAGTLYLDIPNDILRTENGLTLYSSGLVTQAQQATVYLKPAVAIGQGSIRSEDPPFESAGIVVDTVGNKAFLTAPYTYRDGPFTLRSNTPGDLLQVVWTNEADGSSNFEASSQADPDIYNALSRYIRVLVP